MDENKNLMVPYVVYEAEQARGERRERRWFIAFVFAVILLFLSNVFWLYEWCQYDYVGSETTSTYQQDGGMNIIGDRNEATYGPESNSNEKDQSP